MGASSGIGLACLQESVSRGWRVLACVRQPAALDDALAQFPLAHRVECVSLDVSSGDSIQRAAGTAMDWITEASASVGIVNAIGVGAVKPVELTSSDDYHDLFQVNVFGPMAFIQALMPSLRKQGGRIVHVGSTSGRIASPLTGNYAATKATLDALVACQRLELAGSNIHVTLLEPGVVNTPFWDKLKAQQQHLLPVLRAYGLERYERLLGRRCGGNPPSGSFPAQVARQVAALLATRAPRRRYACGKDAYRKLALQRLLPDTWFEWLQMRRLG
ncbi:SDR family NAD(P)-dependent oxidoreductase [Methylolobus aquaticus]